MHVFILGGLVGCWLFVTPFIWAQTPAHAALSFTVGLLSMGLSASVGAWSRARAPIALLGFLLAVVGLVFPAGIGQLANDCTVGVVLLLAGVAPSVEVRAATAVATATPRTQPTMAASPTQRSTHPVPAHAG